MVDQFSLPGMSAPQQPTDRLFVGIFPEPAIPLRITRTAEQLRARHALRGIPLPPERFHVTLFHLGDYVGLPEALVRTATEAAATISARPFAVSFDRAGSFTGKSGKLPLVLRGDAGVGPLKDFQQNLGAALRRAGLGRHVSAQFIPHVTLLYDAKSVAEETVEPIGWTVHEFVLVHSLLGKTRHIPIGRWTLRG